MVKNRHFGRSGENYICKKSCIKSKNLPSLSFANIDIEVCMVELDFVGTTVLVMGIYGPHSGTINSFIDSLNSILNIIDLSRICLISDDLNIDIMKNAPQSVQLMNFLQSYHFIPSITKPTRFSCNNTEVPKLTILLSEYLKLLVQIWSSRELDQTWTNDLKLY